MAKRANVFAEDFQSIKDNADNAVFEFIRQGAREEKPVPKSDESLTEKASTPVGDGTQQEMNSDAQSSADSKPQKPKGRRTQQRQAAEKPRRETKPREWGKPVALFNTRIPQEMSDLLDDLVYRLKKEGKPHTKQAIAIGALEAYLEVNGVVTKGEQSHSVSARI